jgi:hypothetical protein
MVPQSPEALFIDGNFFDLSLCAPSSSFFSRSVASCCQIRSATSTDLFFFLLQLILKRRSLIPRNGSAPDKRRGGDVAGCDGNLKDEIKFFCRFKNETETFFCLCRSSCRVLWQVRKNAGPVVLIA